MARSRVVTRSRGVKRHGEWTGSVVVDGSTALPASAVLLDQVFTPTGAGETVIRTRGLFGYQSDQTAATENQNGAVGIGLVSAQAVSVGVTAVPHPATDADWNGWLWHSYFANTLQVATAVGFENITQRIVIDSKAMRKLGTDERIVLVVENSSSSGMRFYFDVRIYSKPF